VAAFRRAVIEEMMQHQPFQSLARVADPSWGNRGRPVGYRREGICGEAGKAMKGRVVALQESCRREYV